MYGLEVLFYGFFHSFVQQDIVAMNQPDVKAERRPNNTSRLRIDLVKGNEIYEIKPDKTYWISYGELQLDNYVRKSGGTLRKGQASDLKLPEYEPLQIGNVTITVTVRAQESLVLYKVTVTKPLESANEIPVLKKDDKPVLKTTTTSSVPSIVFAYVVCGTVLGALGLFMARGPRYGINEIAYSD